jgi:predicted metalloprotease
MGGGGPIQQAPPQTAPPGYGPQQKATTPPPTTPERQLSKKVLGDTEDVWTAVFKAMGTRYEPPTLVLFQGSVRSACGAASAAVGPFYCPVDRKLYLDTAFFDQLARQFGASGDFAQAYVIAHEVGHHVQNLTGILPKFNQMRQNMSETEANEMSMRVELQADCFAGVWGHFTAQKGLLEQGDLEEALNAAQQIGDDTLQKRTQGYVVPESFNHGTSAQRQRWFSRGFANGRLSDCDTFSGDV